MRHFILFLLSAALASAQIASVGVSVGVKAGIPATNALRGYNYPPTSMVDTGRWTVGPTLELRLLYGFSVEADALYRGYRSQQNFLSSEISLEGVTYPPVSYSYFADTKAWDFPLLLKYRVGSRSYRPFVDAGYTWTRATSDVTSSIVCLGSADACAGSSPFGLYYNSGHFNSTQNSGGPTAGVGVEFKFGKVNIAPEVRYTAYRYPARNQAVVLVGFTF